MSDEVPNISWNEFVEKWAYSLAITKLYESVPSKYTRSMLGLQYRTNEGYYIVGCALFGAERIMQIHDLTNELEDMASLLVPKAREAFGYIRSDLFGEILAHGQNS